MAKKKKNAASEPLSFEGAIAKLERIVEQLEEGNAGLAESLKLYEEGAVLLKQGHQLLAEAEQRIEQVSGEDADGNPVLESFEGSAAAVAAKQPAGRGKVSRTRAKQSGGKKARNVESPSETELF